MFEWNRNLFTYKNYKEMMTGYIYLSIILILVISMIINFMRDFDDRIVVNSITLFLFSLGLYWYKISTHKSRSEISMTFMVIISELLLASLVLQEDFLNYTTVFPMLISFALWYFFTLKQALWMSFFHFSFWGIIYTYGYYETINHSLLHNITAMMGLVISYVFMGLFGFSYYLSTSRYQEKLEQANLQQGMLLKEIHHRVKNNLNIVSSMLGIQQITEEDVHVIELIKKNRLRIESIAMIHEILYKNDDFSKINLSEYLTSLLGAIKEMYQDDMEIDVSNNDISLPLEVVLKLGIISNELAINSLKYAFSKQQGKIDISFYVDEEQLCYRYADNGVCHKDKNEIWNHANLGLKLIQMMVKQLNGTIEVLESEGLVYEVKVPV